MASVSSSQASYASGTTGFFSDKNPSTDCLKIQLTGENRKVYTFTSNTTDNELRCPVCLFLSYPPVIVCQNGHTTCEQCAIHLKKYSPSCPEDRGRLLDQFIPHLFMKKTIIGLDYEEREGTGVSISEFFESTVTSAKRSPDERQRFAGKKRPLTVEDLERIQARLGKEPDSRIAADFGLSTVVIRRRRCAQGIDPCKSPRSRIVIQRRRSAMEIDPYTPNESHHLDIIPQNR